MQPCEVCGNRYEGAFTVTMADGQAHVFDSFECAIERLAPRCAACNCRVIGHGVQHESTIYCSAHCAREAGISGLADHN
jgi:hypothetical protein